LDLSRSTRRLQIRCGRPHEAQVISVIAKPDIASIAKQAADLAGRMAMIDAKRQAGPLADRACIVLPLQDGFELLQRKAMGGGTLFGAIFRICPPLVLIP